MKFWKCQNPKFKIYMLKPTFNKLIRKICLHKKFTKFLKESILRPSSSFRCHIGSLENKMNNKRMTYRNIFLIKVFLKNWKNGNKTQPITKNNLNSLINKKKVISIWKRWILPSKMWTTNASRNMENKFSFHLLGPRNKKKRKFMLWRCKKIYWISFQKTQASKVTFNTENKIQIINLKNR